MGATIVASPTASDADSIKLRGCWLLLLTEEKVDVFVQSVYSFDIVKNISCESSNKYSEE